MSDAVRLQISVEQFLAFCRDLEAERSVQGAGPGARLGISQRSDALQVIAALNQTAGWLPPGVAPAEVTAEAILARHLAPVLCENPSTRAALEAVLQRGPFPGAFQPPLPKNEPLSLPPEKPPPKWRAVFLHLLRSELRWRWLRLLEFWGDGPLRYLALAGGVVALLGVAAIGVFRSGPDPCSSLGSNGPGSRLLAAWCNGSTGDKGSGGGGGGSVGGDGQAAPDLGTKRPFPASFGPASLGALDRAVAVLRAAGFDMSPAQLAEHLATTGPVDLHPALYLDAMLRRWPLPADLAIPRSRLGALAVVNFGLASAALEGDTGALTAIRARLADITDRAVERVMVEGLWLPERPNPEDTAAPTLAALNRIDPALARMAVDDVTMAFWGSEVVQTALAKVTSRLIDTGDANLRGNLSPDDLSNLASELQLRFGVNLAIPTDPAEADPVTLNEIFASIRTSLDEEAPMPASFQSPLSPWPRAISWLPLVPVALAAVWAAAGFNAAFRRRLEDWPKASPPRAYLIVPAPDIRDPTLASPARQVARALRFAPPRQTAALDIEASLKRSLRQGGYFVPVPRQRRDVAAHVVLIRRRTMAEHQPRRMAALLRQLELAGLSMAVFEYAFDPGRVRPFGEAAQPTRTLDSLAQDYPDARLILVTPGDEFAGTGAYGASAATVATLCGWQHRTVVTPVPPAAWGLREFALSSRLQAPLARVEADGLPDLAAIFSSDPGPARPAIPTARGMAADWVRQARATKATQTPVPALPPILAFSEAEAALPAGPDPARTEAVVAALRRWLGPEGYLWLQACASYPALRYPLTRWLGVQMLGRRAAPRLFAQLSLLAWFSVGRMPAAVATRLRQDLDPAEADRIECAFTDFYARYQIEGRSPAQDGGRDYRGDRVAAEPDPLLRAAFPGARMLPEGLKRGLQPTGEAEATRQRLARRLVLADRLAGVAAGGGLGVALWAVWPDRLALPLAPASWLPAVAVGVVWVVVGAAVVVWLAALRRARRGRPGTARGAR